MKMGNLNNAMCIFFEQIDLAPATNYLTQSRLAYNNLVYVRGHSEGSLIVTRWLEKQFENNSKFKNRIGGIFLSGVPMEDFATLYQYEFDQKQMKALNL